MKVENIGYKFEKKTIQARWEWRLVQIITCLYPGELKMWQTYRTKDNKKTKSDEIPLMCNILLYLRDKVNNVIFLLFFHHQNHTIKLISFWCFRDLSYSEESNYRHLSYTHKPVGALSMTFYTILRIIKTLIEHIWSFQCILELFYGKQKYNISL